MNTIEAKPVIYSDKPVTLPPEMERAIKQTEFINNMLAVAKEFHLYVFWRESDKKNPVLKLPWK